MAVRFTSVTDVTRQAAPPSNLLNTLLLASLLGGSTCGFSANTLAVLLALSSGADMAVPSTSELLNTLALLSLLGTTPSCAC